MSSIVVEMSGDEAKLLRSLQRVIAKQNQTENGMKKVERSSKRAGRGVEKSFGSQAAGHLKTFATGLIGAGGILAGIQLVNRELQRMVDLGKEVANITVTDAAAKQNLIRNLAGTSKEQKQQVLKGVEQISETTNVEQKFIAEAAAQGLSASGQDIDSTMKALDFAARAFAEAPDQIAMAVGALLDLGKVTGSSDPLVNAGFQQFVAANSRVVSPQEQARNIPRALIGFQGSGGTSQEAAAVFAAVSNAAADITGEQTGTAMISLGDQLKEFFKEDAAARGVLRRAGISEERADQMSFVERRNLLRENERLAKRFEESASFERKTKAPILDLVLKPQSLAAREFERVFAAANQPDQQFKDMAQDTLASRDLVESEEVAKVRRMAKEAGESAALADKKNAMVSELRSMLEDMLDRSGASGTQKMFELKSFDLSTYFGDADPEKAVADIIERLESRRDTLRRPPNVIRDRQIDDAPIKNPLQVWSHWLQGLGLPTTPTIPGVNPDQAQNAPVATVLNDLIIELRKLQEGGTTADAIKEAAEDLKQAAESQRKAAEAQEKAANKQANPRRNRNANN